MAAIRTATRSLALSRALVTAAPSRQALSLGAVRAMGGHAHGPETFDPPFHRIPMPNKPLHEEDELIWNDGVAPETALDFDAPHVSKTAGLLWWLGGFAFFYSVWRFAKATGHPAKKPSADRDLPESTKTAALGGYEHGKF